MKLQKVFFLVLGLAFLVSLGSLISGGSNQKNQSAQTLMSGSVNVFDIRDASVRDDSRDFSGDIRELEGSSMVITPAHDSAVYAGSTIQTSCTHFPAPIRFQLIGALIQPYQATMIYDTRTQGGPTGQGVEVNQLTTISGSVTVPQSGTGEFHIQCVAHLADGTLSQSNTLHISSTPPPPPPTTDTQNPTRPTNMSITGVTSSSISLSWSPSTDNVAVAGYNIYRNHNGTSGVNTTTPYATVSHPTTTFTDSGLIRKTYNYRIRAIDTSGNLSPWATTVPTSTGSTSTAVGSSLPVVQPPQPNPGTTISTTAVDPTSNSLTVKWNASTSPNVFEYEIFSNFSNGGGTTAVNTTTPIATVSANADRVFIHQPPLNPSTQYRYRVRALDDAGNKSTLSNTARGTTLAQVVTPPATPPAPSVALGNNPAAGHLPHSSVVVSWNQVSGLGYKVFRSNTSGGTYTQVPSTTANLVTNGTFTNTGLSANTNFYYKIQACHTATPTSCSGHSNPSNLIKTDPAPDTTAPPLPGGLTAGQATINASGVHSIPLSWNAVTDPTTPNGPTNPVKYRLYRNTASTGTYTQVGGDININSYTDNTGLSAGTTYFYKIQACDSAPTPNCSAQSNPISRATLSLPSVPTGVSVGSPTTSSLTVSWNAVTGASSYKIYRLNSAGTAIDGTVPPLTVLSPNLNRVVEGLSAGTVYRFLVTALNAVGESSTSPQGSTTAEPATNNHASGTTSSPQITLHSVELVRPISSANPGVVISLQDLQPLTEANNEVNTINIGSQGAGFGTGDVTIRARTNQADTDTGSVRFNLNGNNITPIENAPPYMMFGDMVAWPSIVQGPQTVVITPYSADNAGGQVGVPQTFTLNFVNNDDVTPPENPTNVRVTYRSPSQIKVSWTNSPSPDVKSYRVYRNGVSVGFVNHPTNTFVDEDVLLTSSYSYKVRAEDHSGNLAAESANNPDSNPPIPAPATDASIKFGIGNQVRTNASTPIRSTPESNPSATNQPFETIGEVTNGPVWVAAGGGAHYWYVDFPGNNDGWVNEDLIDVYVAPTTTLTILPADGGTVSAGSIVNLSCTYNPTGNAPSQMRLWGATITPYAEFQVPQVNNVKTISGQVTVPAGSTGEFHVRCMTYGPDNGVSNVLTITSGPPAPDTTPPTITNFSPSAGTVLPFGTTSTNIAVTTNENATCKWHTTNVDYGSMANTMSGTGSTNHSSNITGLTNGTSYTRHVRCRDTAGNEMTSSQSITFSVASATEPPPPPGGDQSTQVSTTCPTNPTPLPNNGGARTSVALCAAVQNTTSPATITLRWTPVTGRTVSSITIWRKVGESGSWTQVPNQPSASSQTWTDTNVTVGTYYEYKVRINNNAFGYISSGINVPSEVSRGKIVLVIDNTFQTSLEAQIQNLINDLNADRWVVAPIYVSRTATAASVRNSIKAIYDADSANTKAVYLLGSVPVPTLGNFNPDNHVSRAISSDAYYAEMTSAWNSVTQSGCSVTLPQNVGGTGTSPQLPVAQAASTFCHSTLPSDAELQVGRIDMRGITAFGGNEQSLLSAYLTKVSNFKNKNFVPNYRSISKDLFSGLYGWETTSSAWSTFSSTVGSQNMIFDNINQYPPLPATLNGQSHVWVLGAYNGANTQGSIDAVIGNVATLQDSPNYGGVFNMLWASYIAEWNDQNSLLRSVLARGNAMTSVLAGPRHWYFHSMGMGKNIGYGYRVSINNTTANYEPIRQGGAYNINSNNGYMTLLGDPTLRMHYVKPPTNLNLTSSGGKVAMSWSASSDEGIGYNVYEILPNQIRRVNPSIITGTSYTSNDNYAVGKKYMVTRVKIEKTNSGAYQNESLGVIAVTSGTVPPVDNLPPNPPANVQITSHGQNNISLNWSASSDNGGGVVSSYKVWRDTVPGGSHSQNVGTVTAGASFPSFNNEGLTAGTQYCYKVSAIDDSGNESAKSPSSGACQTTASPPSAPSQPSNLTATAVSSSQIVINWQDNSTNETSFTLQRATNSEFSQGLFTMSVSSDSESYTISSGLSPQTQYFFRLRAENSNCQPTSCVSDWTTTANATTQSLGGGGQVLGLMAPVGPNNSVDVSPGVNTNGTDYFIACGTGNDSNNGTSASTPWRTISRYNQQIGLQGDAIQPGSRIFFKRGENCKYRGSLNVNSSGTLNQPIKFGAYGQGDAPIISGFESVPSNWVVDAPNVYRVNIGQGKTVKYLFASGSLQTEAQTPNAGSWFFSNSRTVNSLSSSQISSSPSLVNKKIVLRSEPWSWVDRTITSHSGSTVGFTNDVTFYPNEWEAAGWGFALQGDRSFLDSPGEWFYNSSTGMLYFRAPGDVNPNTLSVEVSTNDFGFNIGSGRQSIHISNIILEGYNERAVRIEGNRALAIENTEIRNSATAINGGMGGSYSVANTTNIRNNYIHDIYGAYAIWLLGGPHLVENNVIERVFINPMTDRNPDEWANGFGIYTAGVESNFTIRGNRIHETGYAGIGFSGGRLNNMDTVVEKNLVTKSLMNVNDGGAIVFDHINGAVIRNNVVKDTQYDLTTMPILYSGYKKIAFQIYFGNDNIKNIKVEGNVAINSPSTGIWRDSNEVINNTNIEVVNNLIYGAQGYGVGVTPTSVDKDFPDGACNPWGNSVCFMSHYNDIWSGNKIYQTSPDQLSVHQQQTYSNGSSGNNSQALGSGGYQSTKFGNWFGNYFYNPFNRRSFEEIRKFDESMVKVGDPVVMLNLMPVRQTSECTSSTVINEQPAGSVGVVQEISGNCFRVSFPSGVNGWISRYWGGAGGGIGYASRLLNDWQTYTRNPGSGNPPNTQPSYTLSNPSQVPPLYVNDTMNSMNVNIGTGKCDSNGQPLPSTVTLQNFSDAIVPEQCSLQQ